VKNMSLKERKEAAATDEVICKCFITGTPLQKSLWERIKDVFSPNPQQFVATISAVESKDPDFKWVTIVEAVEGCTISAIMDLRRH
jgi:hypothetical protein